MSAGVICLFIFFSSSRFGFWANGNRRSDVHFASLFYNHLVSSECRLALVLYRLYRLLADICFMPYHCWGRSGHSMAERLGSVVTLGKVGCPLLMLWTAP